MIFTQIRNGIDTIIHDTTRELDDLRAGQVTNYSDLLSRTKAAVYNLGTKMKGLEATSLGEPREGRSGVGGVYTGQWYLHLKSTIPEQLGKEPEKWREWRRDILGYLDTVNPGLKKFLSLVETLETDPSIEWLEL